MEILIWFDYGENIHRKINDERWQSWKEVVIGFFPPTDFFFFLSSEVFFKCLSVNVFRRIKLIKNNTSFFYFSLLLPNVCLSVCVSHQIVPQFLVDIDYNLTQLRH